MAELTPIRGAKYPLRTTYASHRLDHHELLKKNANFYKKLARIRQLANNNFMAHAVVAKQKLFTTSGGLRPLGSDPLRTAIWDGWCKRADIAQTKQFTEILNEICGEMCLGDCLVVLRTSKKTSANRVSSFIDIVNSGRVETPTDFKDGVNPATGGKVILGVEYLDGVEVGYHVYNGTVGNKKTWIYVPRYNKKTGRFVSILMRNPESPALSVRGSGIFDAGIPEVEDGADLADSARQSAIAKSNLSIIFEHDSPTQFADGFKATKVDTDTGEVIDNTDYDSKNELVTVGELPTGSVMSAPVGTKIHTLSHTGNVDLGALLKMNKQAFATAVGRPYEIIFDDYTGVNFSGGKLLHDPFWRIIEMWVTCFVKLCQELYQAVTDEGLLIRGIDPVTVDRRVMAWVGAPKTEADEIKATTSALNKISGGMMTLSEYHAKRGQDYSLVLDRYKENIEMERSKLDGYSLTEALLKASPQNKHVVAEEKE